MPTLPATLELIESYDVLDEQFARLDVERELAVALAQLSSVPADVEAYASCPDAKLTSALAFLGELERMTAGLKSVVVGLVAQRSRPELGLNGIAQRNGHKNVEEFLRHETGASLVEVKRSVELARIVVEAAELPDPASGAFAEPVASWLHAAARMMQSGRLSGEQFRAIRDGIGRPLQDVTADVLSTGVDRLLEFASHTDADRLRVLSRELRDELDEAGIRDRETALREQRSFRITKLPDGMSRVVWLLEPESAAVVHDIFDRATSPKLGGPRFVDSERMAQAEAIETDPRTPFQLASDVMVELLRQGVDGDSSRLLGSQAPAVRVVVRQESLSSRTGHGYLEAAGPDGGQLAVSIETVERLACANGTEVVKFDEHDRPLDVERAERLFTRKQKVAMAVRDGGCLMCGRPPSWSEAHHIKHFVRDLGPTNIDQGVLLCRSCHLRVHNQSWEIERAESHGIGSADVQFVLIPPETVDPARAARPLPSRARVMGDLARA